MVSDQEPRYRFEDSNGNITGTVFERGGELVVQEGRSGNENELVLQSDGTVRAKRLAGGYLYAGAFDGSDADARLDNALAAATDGETVYLESATYTDDRTITTRITFIGPAIADGAEIDATWEFTGNGSGKLKNLNISGSVVIDAFVFFIIGGNHSETAPVTNKGARLIFTACRGGDVTLESGARPSVIDGCVETTVTDNSSDSVVGDIA